MKTPLQELLQHLNELKETADGNSAEVYAYETSIELVEGFLEKEKEVIQRAYKQGVIDEYGDTIDLDTIIEAEEYYNRTFRDIQEKRW